MKVKKQDRISGMLSRKNLGKVKAMQERVKEIISGKKEPMLKAS